ncbi:hypothetical protein [Azospirillum sp. TSH7]|uniref:hypothetical protein n=2 Tax=unclassified Azospirillum TaxID=2630922 RepID=UPI0011B1DE15|nr:hypothetical protein [Azospirillum sp. TSH7]
MPAKPGQTMVGGYVEAELARRFAVWARQTDGSSAAALRRLITQAIDGHEPAPPSGSGTGRQVGVRLKADEHAALVVAAAAHGTSPANWLRALALVHLTRRPQWSPAELEALRAIFTELRAISTNLTRLSAHSPDHADPELASEMAQEAADRVRLEMRRVVAVLTGHFEQWGLPDAERPTATAGFADRGTAPAGTAATHRRRKRRDDHG